MFFKRIWYYLNPATMFRKEDKNFNLKAMHWINRISIYIFIICAIVLAIRYWRGVY